MLQRNHTATHLVHAALRDILGPHVKQYGSLVGPNRLRFDFAHFRPLSSRDIDEIETIVNNEVRKNERVATEVMSIQDAVAKGALAFFGDKYGEQVRVVTVESFSKELCGGTHCRQTGDIGLFRIVSETGVAAGVRRIEAQTGSGATGHDEEAGNGCSGTVGSVEGRPVRVGRQNTQGHDAAERQRTRAGRAEVENGQRISGRVHGENDRRRAGACAADRMVWM